MSSRRGWSATGGSPAVPASSVSSWATYSRIVESSTWKRATSSSERSRRARRAMWRTSAAVITLPLLLEPREAGDELLLAPAVEPHDQLEIAPRAVDRLDRARPELTVH